MSGREAPDEQPLPEATTAIALVLDEHAELRDVLAQLAEATDAHVLLGLLNRLQGLLGPHFAREEAPGGFLHLIAEPGDPRADDVRGLIAEHGALLATVAGLLARLRDGPAHAAPALQPEIATLLARLHAHDERETELLGLVRGARDGLAIDRPAPAEASSRALAVNLRRTAVDVVIPAEQAVLLDITADLYGVQQATRTLLRELNHPYVGWTQTLDDLHRRAMNDFAHHLAHPRAAEAVAVVCGLHARAVEAVGPALRDTAVRHQLHYLEHVACEAGARLPEMRPVLARAVERLRQALATDPAVAAAASPRAKVLARTLASGTAGETDPAGEGALHLLADTLEHTYARWLATDDPADWWRALADAGPDVAVPAAVATIAHARLTVCRATLTTARAHPGGLRAQADTLLALPDQATIERGYLDAAAALEPTDGRGAGDALAWVRWYMRILSEPRLAAVHGRALTELAHRYVAVLRDANQTVVAELVRETFAVLGRGALATSAVACDLIERVGREILAAGDPTTSDLLVDAVLALDFPRPEFAGFTDEWGVRVNPAHLRGIRTFLALITANPCRARRLLAALVVHLRTGGVFLADTDLFQRDVSRLLAHDLASVRHEIRQLLRLLPVYFQELGAEGALRDVSTRLDEIGGRQDPLCNFLRKQCHVESNPRLVGFIEAIGAFWATGDRTVLRPYVPAGLYARLDDGAARPPGIARAFAALSGDDPRRPFVFDPLTLAARLAAVADLRAVEREKVALFCELRRLVGRKYELAHDDLLERLRAFHRLPAAAADELERALADDRPAAALAALLDVLERLETMVADRAPTEPLEDIYHKRHIAAGIPSMYGRYHESRFDAVGLGLRVESLAGVLLERLAARCDVEEAGPEALRAIAGWLALSVRALRVDGCRVGGLAMHTTLLEEALADGKVGLDQYLDVFRCLAHDVQQLLRLHIFDVYEPVLEPLLGRMVDRGLLAPENGSDRVETVLKASERFLRDVIAGSFALPQLDRLVGQTLRALAQRRARRRTVVASPRPPRLADGRWCVGIHDAASDVNGPFRLGSKGHLVRSMARAGFPVPPGFILATDLFHAREALRADAALARAVWDRIREAVTRLERASGRRFGDPRRPLLLSVRSGAALSMPGMLDTLLNVGMSPEVALGFADTGRPWAAWDAYRRFLQLWGMSHGIPRDDFDAVIRDAKRRFGAAKKSALEAEHMRDVALHYRQLVLDHAVAVVDDPWEQLRRSVELVQGSWHAERARLYRHRMQIAEGWGTAVVVQCMVYGNLSDRSGTGVTLTCDPRHGAAEPVELYGDFVVQSQGDDVVGGLVETLPVGAHQRAAGATSSLSLERDFPAVHAALLHWARLLVVDQGMVPQEIEFTFEGDRAEDLYVLQTRDLVASPTRDAATFLPTEALARARLATGIGAGGGALAGRVALTAADVARLRREAPDEPVLLLRADTVPDDVPLLLEADGMVTALGGATSHAAVAARRLDRTCVVGCRNLEVDETAGRAWLAGQPLAAGEWLSIDGFAGAIYRGRHPTTTPRGPRTA